MKKLIVALLLVTVTLCSCSTNTSSVTDTTTSAVTTTVDIPTVKTDAGKELINKLFPVIEESSEVPVDFSLDYNNLISSLYAINADDISLPGYLDDISMPYNVLAFSLSIYLHDTDTIRKQAAEKVLGLTDYIATQDNVGFHKYMEELSSLPDFKVITRNTAYYPPSSSFETERNIHAELSTMMFTALTEKKDEETWDNMIGALADHFDEFKVLEQPASPDEINAMSAEQIYSFAEAACYLLLYTEANTGGDLLASQSIEMVKAAYRNDSTSWHSAIDKINEQLQQ